MWVHRLNFLDLFISSVYQRKTSNKQAKQSKQKSIIDIQGAYWLNFYMRSFEWRKQLKVFFGEKQFRGRRERNLYLLYLSSATLFTTHVKQIISSN